MPRETRYFTERRNRKTWEFLIENLGNFENFGTKGDGFVWYCF